MAHTSLPGADLLVRRKAGRARWSISASTSRASSSIRRRRPGSARSRSRSAVRGAGDLDAGAPGLRLRAVWAARSAPSAASDWPASAPRCWPSTWRRRRPCSMSLVHTSPRLDERRCRARARPDGGRGAAGGGRHVPLPVPARVRRGVRRVGLRAAGGGLPETLPAIARRRHSRVASRARSRASVRWSSPWAT